MNIFLSILFIIGAMMISLGAFSIHLGKAYGAGFLTFGIILLGISAGIVRIGA
jgi:hypothetical protein